MSDKQPFTETETKINDLLLEAHREFLTLPVTHSMERMEWITTFHRLQDLLGNRVLRRDYPDHFKTSQ